MDFGSPISDTGLGTLDFANWAWALKLFPSIMNPEPISRVSPHRCLECAIDVQHNGLRRARLTLFLGGNFRVLFNPPASQADPVADAGIESAMIAQCQDGRGGGSGAIMAEEGEA